ncbi:MAG: putative glycolipid-binding domain-containing protein [Gaiellaceae bacterium]
MEGATRSVVWVKDDPFGVEFAEIGLARDRLTATGVAIAAVPVPYRLDYEIEIAPGFGTARLGVVATGDGWERTLALERDEDDWSIAVSEVGRVDLPPPGGDVTVIDDAADFDLGLSPVTNLIPWRRRDLLNRRGPLELTVAWVSVPDLGVQPDGQRYTYLRSEGDEHLVAYEATDGTFAADIRLDRDGIAIDYPGIARRLTGGS